MPISFGGLQLLFRSGQFGKILEELRRWPGGVESAPIECRVLFAETLQRAGKIEWAGDIALAASKERLSTELRAQCEIVLGLVKRDTGHLHDALQHFQASERLAKEHKLLSLSGLAGVLIFRLLAERQRPDEIRPVLTEVRRHVIRAGDPHLTALLHETVSRHEAQIGNFDEADRHLQIANSLVEAHPNSWLEQYCALNAFCLEFYRCDLRRAQKHLARAKSLASVTGALEGAIANNEGHLHLEFGRLEEAERVLTDVARSGFGEAQESALEGLARLCLISNRFQQCEIELDRLQDRQRAPGAVTSFPYRASLITRVRLRLEQRKWADAVEAADIASKQGHAVSDHNLIALACFFRSIADARLGQIGASSEGMCTASQLGVWGIREYQGVLAAQTGALVDLTDGRLGDHYRRRATRVESMRAAGAPTRKPTFSSPSEIFSSPIDRLPALTNALAGVFDHSYDPRLLGHEVAGAIQILDCSPKTVVVHTRETTALSKASLNSLPLGHTPGGNLELRCEMPPRPEGALVLNDVLRIGRAAIELERYRQEERNRAALWPADPIEEQGGALFVAEEMQDLLAMARRIAPTNVPVLITGETGTGKEVLARAIHALSNRAKATFLPFNCTSTPKDMLDSQLFGHRRGSFTGATDHFQGVIRGAAGGTLFLDEIGDMGLEVQPKLLRFLESNEVHPIGETQPQRVDVRVIAATNVNLDTLVADGRFREDLFYRLNIVPLHVPPLRQRRVEIPSLAHYYLHKYAHEYRKGDLRLSEDTMEYLVLYRWPGNVRQLANEMRRLAALAESGAVLMPAHLSPELAASRRTIPASDRVLDSTEVVVRLDQPMPAALQHLERAMLQYALAKTGGRMEETAAMLGLSRKGLYLKRQRFGIDPPETAAGAAVA